MLAISQMLPLGTIIGGINQIQVRKETYMMDVLCWKWRGFVYSPLYVVSPSSRVEGARSVNGNDNGVKIKNSSCDTDDVRDKEGEDASHRIVGIASNFESRIEKLERVIAKLEAAKNGQRVQNTGVKAKPSAP
ncbi:hypothetical protein JHK87_023028 [Glycine soja]|nr:hypothetical protein JHK87_023028 [Glycine soja]